METTSSFYNAILAPLGIHQRETEPDGGPDSKCWVYDGESLPRFYVYEPFDGLQASAGNGTMIAFEAASEKVVDNAYAAGLSSGGGDAGKPGERPHYGDGYYGAYLRDPDGNKVHIVFRGDLR